MASGNSGTGSIQSSSSGAADEEYDSRTQSIPNPFLNNNPTSFGSLLSNPQFLPHQNPTHLINIPSAQNPHPFTQTASNFQFNAINNTTDGMNLWSVGLGSDQASLTNQSLQASPQAHSPRPAAQPKNPKKRTRASRRAPTTVLTTDTTNFRQMVQEFTGIPTAPFAGSSYQARMRVPLIRPGPLYSLIRPSSQNISPPFSSSSSPSMFNATMIDAIVTSSNKTTTAAVHGNILSDQDLRNLQLPNSLGHGNRFEASASIDFGNYLSGFRNQQFTSAAEGDLKINDDDLWRSRDQTVKSDHHDGVQQKFMPFDDKT